MVDMFIGGEVGIDVNPDTRGFRRELERFLHSLDDDFEIRIRPDMSEYTRAKRDINGDRIVKTVEFRTDAKAVRREVAALDQELENIGRDFALPDSLEAARKNLKTIIQQSQKLKRTLDINDESSNPMLRLDDERKVLADYRQSLKDVSAAQADELSKMRDELDRFMQTSYKYDPLGNDVTMKLNRKVQEFASNVERTINRLSRNPGAQIDIGWDERAYERYRVQFESMFRDIEELDRKEARVKVYADGADRLQRQLDSMRRSMASIPEDVASSVEKAIGSLRDAERQVRDNPDARFTLNVRADVDEANRQLKKLKDENDKISMDVDVATAGAKAHLLQLTRPRTVDVFARFHGTDLGKIIDGIATKGTGIETVTSQFSKLVDTFDKLDKVVPKYATIGSVFGALAAGATNLTSSALGVGASLLSMSKAAMAAPGALIGLGAAMVVLRHAWGDKGGKFSEEIELTSTKIADLGNQMDDAFYGKATPAIRGLVNDISGTLIPGITGIADAEGNVAAGLAKVITESDKAGELSNIFTQSRIAIDELNPGLQSLVKGFLSLGDTTSRYLPRAASYFSDMAASFARWVRNAQDSGAIEDAMVQAVRQGGYLKSSIGSLTGVLTGLYNGLAQSENGLQGFSETLAGVDKAVNSVGFQSFLDSLRSGAQSAQNQMRGVLSGLGDSLYRLRDETAGVFTDMGANVANGITMISRVLSGSQNGIREFSTGIREGFEELSDAVGDNSGMFDQLLSTAGSLSKTMGTTLANAIRVNAPLIKTLASAAQAAAEAFNRLPAPIQSAVALWATFGRAGKTALDSLQEGMLAGTMRTLQYRKAMQQLGMESKGAKQNLAGMFTLFATANDIDVTPLRNVRKEWTNTTGAMNKAKVAFKGVGAAGNVALSALGGWTTLGVGAAIAGVTLAVGDYMTKANASAEASRSIGAALREIPDSARTAADGLSEVGKQMQSLFSDSNFAETGWNWLSDATTGFDTAEEAGKKLGVTTEQMAKAATLSGDEYQKLHNRLQSIIDDQDNYVYTDMGPVANEQVKAAQKVNDAISEGVRKYREQAEQTAIANGYTKEYADSLIDFKEDSDSVSIALMTATQRQEMLARAQQNAIDINEKASQAQIAYRNAQADWGELLDSMPSRIQQVNALVALGEHVWNQQADSFDYSTEAGRLAQQSMDAIGSSAENYVKSMIAAGASQQDVIGKAGELGDAMVEQAKQMDIPKTAVEELQKQYNLTPEQVTTLFKAEVEQSKADLRTYLSDLRALYPGKNNTAIFTTVLNGINTGALTSTEQVQNAMDNLKAGLKDGTMSIVFDANEEPFVMKTDDAKKLGLEFKNGHYSTTLDAEDLASDKISGLIRLLSESGLDGKQIIMFINAEGNAKLSVDEVRKSLELLGLSDTDIEILMNANGNAPEQMELVRQKLTELGATPEQIEWFLKAIDQTSDGTSSAQRNIDSVQQKQPASIKAQDDTGEGTSSAQRNIDLVKQGTPAPIDAEDNTKPPTDTAKSNIGSVKGKKVNVDAATGGLAGVQNLGWAIEGLHDKTVTITTNFMRNFIDNYMKTGDNYAPGVSLPRASGGRIHGPGTGTSDSIPAMVSNGEHVIRAAAVRRLDARYGRGFLDELNATGKVPARVMPSVSEIRRLATRLPSDYLEQTVEINMPSGTDRVRADSTPRTTVSQTFNVRTDNPEYLTRIVGEKMRQYMR